MNNRHSKRTQHGPSVLSIAAGIIATSAAMTAMVFSLPGPGRYLDWHDMLGAAGCLGLAVLLFAQTLSRVIEFQVAQQRRARRREAEQQVRDDNTGLWIGPYGSRLSVRWEPRDRTWYVIDPASRAERAWQDTGQLIGLIGDLEAVGYAHLDDPGTRTVRARLDLPGWADGPGKSWDDEIGGRTVKLDYHPGGRTEVMRDEAREEWMSAETQVIRDSAPGWGGPGIHENMGRASHDDAC